MEFKRKRDLVPTRKTLNPYGNYRGSREVDLSEKVCFFEFGSSRTRAFTETRLGSALGPSF